jgi:Flp pilus assembly protein TadD
LGHDGRAADAFKSALRLRVDYAAAYNGLGLAYVGMGRPGEAIGAFQQVIRLRPDAAEARLNLGVVYLSLGRKDAALSQHAALRDLNPVMAARLFEAVQHNKLLVVTNR